METISSIVSCICFLTAMFVGIPSLILYITCKKQFLEFIPDVGNVLLGFGIFLISLIVIVLTIIILMAIPPLFWIIFFAVGFAILIFGR